MRTYPHFFIFFLFSYLDNVVSSTLNIGVSQNTNYQSRNGPHPLNRYPNIYILPEYFHPLPIQPFSSINEDFRKLVLKTY